MRTRPLSTFEALTTSRARLSHSTALTGLPPLRSPASTTDFSTLNFNTPHRDQLPFGAPLPNEVEDYPDFPASPFDTSFNFTTSHLRAANKQFDNANEHADIILAVNRDRADAHARPRPLADTTAVNLPHGPLPSLHTRVPVTDDVRKAIGRSGAKRGGDGDELEIVESDDENGGGRCTFTGPRLIKAAGAAIDIQPFLAPHGSKTAAWKLVVEMLLTQKEFRNTTCFRCERPAQGGIIGRNPGKNKKLANLIGKGTAAGVTIAALLEQLEQQYNTAKGKSDAAKEEVKKKIDEDREGGDAIRGNSMITMGKRKRTASDDEITDNELADDPAVASRSATTSSSIETIDPDADDVSNASKAKGNKRRRCNARTTSSDTTELLALMKAENERRAKHDEHIE
ncbi:hypothetical protein MVEN_02185200 [Mycena venus]|uniref:Uncharacterized protein n=1 Tax=Mycena venus TaxID=2733690 RepID=A0A8H6X957_9AGAR|nr:hypothetical protein MVEN_02185200 [Mycena venus]